MTYFLDNPMYPKEPMLEAINKHYIAISDTQGFLCVSDICDICPIASIEDPFCNYPSRHTERRKQIATIIKTEYPEYFI